MEDLKSLPTSYSQARKIKATYYFTGKPCKHGHIDKRQTSSCVCVVCAATAKKKFRDNPLNKIKEKKTKQSWYKANREKSLARSKRWREDNKDYHLQKLKEYRETHPEVYAYHAAVRRASLVQRTPDWLTEEHHSRIKEYYIKCPKGSHVDHIVPLNGENVSGLHVPWNLQILTAKENMKKGNRYAGNP